MQVVGLGAVHRCALQVAGAWLEGLKLLSESGSNPSLSRFTEGAGSPWRAGPGARSRHGHRGWPRPSADSRLCRPAGRWPPPPQARVWPNYRLDHGSASLAVKFRVTTGVMSVIRAVSAYSSHGTRPILNLNQPTGRRREARRVRARPRRRHRPGAYRDHNVTRTWNSHGVRKNCVRKTGQSCNGQIFFSRNKTQTTSAS